MYDVTIGQIYNPSVPLPLQKSPRMRVDTNQMDHFISFITATSFKTSLLASGSYIFRLVKFWRHPM